VTVRPHVDWCSTEVAPGIRRIESVLGPRPFSQYLVHDERALLVDTGVKDTPEAVILPCLGGVQPDLVLNSHADVDHFGGNAAIRAAAPRALFCAHELDVRWVESAETIMRERYGWYAAHDLAYDPDTSAWLREAMGPDVPVDIHLRGGERIRLGRRLTVEVLHLPGHTAGHLGIWEPDSRTAIVLDAVMARGLLDTDREVIAPPPYFDVAAYLATVEKLRRLEPRRLLTAHYDVIEGDDVARFLAETIAFVEDAARTTERALAAAGGLSLKELVDLADPQLGPFTSMPNELGGSLRAHLQALVADGRALEDPSGLRWSPANDKGGQ
jgi:glyoxylase-like metal-dependent hydrolase (beta-lactamase superfamily II)